MKLVGHDLESQKKGSKERLIRVRIRPYGRVKEYLCELEDITKGDWVVVDTDHGPELGQVVSFPSSFLVEKKRDYVGRVMRKANQQDMERGRVRQKREKEAYDYCLKCIAKLKLPMNLVSTEAFFDGSKIIFYFTADGRIDFRELVKMLVQRFKTRIEMRQIGVRNEAKLLGGIGCCGRELCCTAFLKDFSPVSVKMAKVQSLPLNPTKISGLCGRLMCCITFEHQIYEEILKDLPPCGKKVQTKYGMGSIVRHNILSRTVTIDLGNGRETELPREEVLKAGDENKG